MWLAIGVSLAAIFALDYLVMFFNDAIVAIPGIFLISRIVGDVLLFLQVAMAIQIMLIGFKGAGAIEAVFWRPRIFRTAGGIGREHRRNNSRTAH